MNRNLVGSIYMYGRFCIKFPQSRMKGERHRLVSTPEPKVYSEKKAFEHFPIGSDINLCPAVVAILDFRST
jgi:hypothetical protein